MVNSFSYICKKHGTKNSIIGMKTLNIFWGIVIMFLCLSCKEREISYKQPVFPVENEAQFELMTPELTYGVKEDIWETDFYLVVFAYDSKTRSYCHIFDKRTGNLMADALKFGRGPGEIQAGYGPFEIQQGIARHFDFMANKILQFPLDSLLLYGPSIIKEFDGDHLRGERFRGSTGKYIVSLSARSGLEKNPPQTSRLTVKDLSGRLISESDNYPEKNLLACYADTYHVSFSPDGTKCAIAPTWSAVLELYDLPSLHTRYIGYFTGQDYEYPTGNIELTEKTAINYSDVYATDEHVFLSFGGDVPILHYNDLPVEEKKLVCNKLDIFDWNGNPVRRIVTDRRINRFCVDAEEKYVYAIVEDLMGRNYIARLPL